jgi:hypothetical protein
MKIFNFWLALFCFTPSLVLAHEASPADVCYDAKIKARAIEQIPSDINNQSDDYLIMRWPYFVDLRVQRVFKGEDLGNIVSAQSLQHTYFTSQSRTWYLRRNSLGGFNIIEPDYNDTVLKLCDAGSAPVDAFISSSRQTEAELRAAGQRRYGSHRN